ncbi:MAG: helix-turn-helix transcriptional regulator [Clostridiales Family XIII bacterium]|nr:helix-turn-helix transcriptional regulator [Clostridiales Family XIII bacterium]
MLIDRNLLKRDLCKMANVGTTIIEKLGRGESVNLDIMLCICKVLNGDIADIVGVVSGKNDFK